jgi:hypothetical protein
MQRKQTDLVQLPHHGGRRDEGGFFCSTSDSDNDRNTKRFFFDPTALDGFTKIQALC